MNIVIEPIVEHEKYKVNDHLVYKNALRNWSCNVDLSDKELKAFSVYEELIIKNSRIKKHTKSLFKY